MAKPNNPAHRKQALKAKPAYGLLIAALAACAFVAAIIPALRAASIDPMSALRAE